MTWPKLLISFLGFWVLNILHGQDKFNNYLINHIDKGLSYGNVTALHEDSLGFVWIGTMNGLNKYDGKVIENYTNDGLINKSIRNLQVTAITNSTNNNLWISSNGNGLIHYDRKLNHLRSCNVPDVPIYLQNIYKIDKERLWLATDSGAFLVNMKHMSIEEHLYPGKFIFEILLGTDSTLWIGSDTLYYREKGSIPKACLLEDGTILNNGILSLYQDSRERIWVGTRNGLYKGTKTNNQWIFHKYMNNPNDPSSLSINNILSILEDQKGRMFIGTENGGLDIYNEANDSFVHFESDPIKDTGISAISIWALMEDSYGQIWAGTFNNGVNVLHESYFEAFYPTLNGPSGNNVSCFAESKNGNIYVGYDGYGIDIFDPKTKSFEPLSYANIQPQSKGAVLWILPVDTTHLLIGQWSGGLIDFNLKTGHSKQYLNHPGDTRSISSNNVFKILEDRANPGNYWVGLWNGGLNYFTRSTGEFKSFNYFNSNNRSISRNSIYSMAYDQENQLWIGTGDRLLKLVKNEDNQQYSFMTYLPNNQLGEDMQEIFVSSIVCDQTGRLWIGANSGGLFVQDKNNDVFREIADKELKEDNVQALVEDDDGRMWVTTAHGLKCVLMSETSDSLEIWSFKENNGLQGELFHLGAGYKASNGDIYIGGNNGFNKFDPSSIKINKRVPPIYLTDFKLFNKSVDVADSTQHVIDRHINLAKEIHLDYDQNVFTIEYIGVNLIHSDQNQYAYQMTGVDKGWNYVGNNTGATYTNLDPGEYTFMVKCANEDGIWGEEYAAIKIIISPPFWGTWTFRILMVVFFIATIILVFKLRTRTIRKQNTILEEQVSLRTEELEKEITVRKNTEKELTNTLQTLQETQSQLVQVEKMSSLGTLTSGIAHELNNPLNFIAGGIHIFNESLKEDNAQHKYKVPMDLLTVGFERSNLIVKSLSVLSAHATAIKKSINLMELIDAIIDHMQSKYADLPFEFETDYNLYGNCVVYESNLKQAIQNIVENAIQAIEEAGIENGKVKISTDTMERSDGKKTVVITIANNGPSIPDQYLAQIFDPFFTTKPPGDGIGLGLTLAYSFVEQHIGQIEVQNQVHGVSFTISFPQIGCISQANQ